MVEKIDRDSSVLELDGLPEEICEQLRHVSPHHLENLLRAIAILVKSGTGNYLEPVAIPAKPAPAYISVSSSLNRAD